MDKFYQACFNRVGWNDTDAGWQLLNLSPGIPAGMKNLYKIRQRGNQSTEYETPEDREDRNLSMLEVICEEGCVGLSQVQYGLADSFGRDNMFCHGYLFPNAYEMLKDPNRILAISDSNFRFTPEDTRQIPTELEMDEPWTEERALVLCDMDRQAYIDYISCVYYGLSSRAKTTIYVKTDGTNQMARALLYLAYSAAPYSLRTKITGATYGKTTSINASLVLTDDLPENGPYIDPVTGENNILTSNLKNRWKRYPFVDYYARNYDTLAPKKDAYYGAIETWLTRMGDPYMQDMDAIRLAFDMIRNNDDSDVAGLLYDWLMLPVPTNETIEQSLADLLRKAIEQDLDLGSDKEELLFQRLETTSSRELIRLGNQYQSRKLMKMQLGDAVLFLNNLTPESQVFNAMRANLSAQEQGLAILREYYLRKTRLAVCSESTYEALEDLGRTFSDLPDMDEVWAVVVDRALEIAKERIRGGESYKKAAVELRDFLSANYKNAAEKWSDYVLQLAEVYDREFRRNFTMDRLDDFSKFYLKQYSGGVEQFDCSLELVKRYQAVRRGEWNYVEEYVASGMPGLSGDDRMAAVKNLLKASLDHGAAESCVYFPFWVTMAQAVDQTPVQLMIENQVRAFCDGELLSRLVVEDPFWTSENLEAFCAQYRACGDSACKRSLDVMNRELKFRADEAKRLQKEQKRQERQERQGRQEGGFGKFWNRAAASDEPQSEPEPQWEATEPDQGGGRFTDEPVQKPVVRAQEDPVPQKKGGLAQLFGKWGKK